MLVITTHFVGDYQNIKFIWLHKPTWATLATPLRTRDNKCTSSEGLFWLSVMVWTDTTFTTSESIILRQNDSWYYSGSYYLGYVNVREKF